MTYNETPQIKAFVEKYHHFLIIQADNPDGDSLGTSVALENILGELGKQVTMFCGVDIPSYLQYINGWDRVEKNLPHKYDAVIIVDNSSESLLESLQKSGDLPQIAKKPTLIIDHHQTEKSITFADISCIHEAVSTSEIVYELCKQLDWPINLESANAITSAIMSDSLGLMSEATTARTVSIVAELIKEHNVHLATLDSRRKEFMKKSAVLTAYKGQLLQRLEYYSAGRIAMVAIPWEEIVEYSQSYNPSMLVMEEMRMVEGVQIAIAFKCYKDGKVTGKIRCNQGYSIADKLAEQFGGGGHAYAAGFKVKDAEYTQLKQQVIHAAEKLLDMKV